MSPDQKNAIMIRHGATIGPALYATLHRLLFVYAPRGSAIAIVSQLQLGADLGIKERQTRNRLEQLEDAGIIETIGRGSFRCAGGGLCRRPNAYRIIPLEEFEATILVVKVTPSPAAPDPSLPAISCRLDSPEASKPSSLPSSAREETQAMPAPTRETPEESRDRQLRALGYEAIGRTIVPTRHLRGLLPSGIRPLEPIRSVEEQLRILQQSQEGASNGRPGAVYDLNASAHHASSDRLCVPSQDADQAAYPPSRRE